MTPLEHAALVLGGGWTVWEDLAALEELVDGPWPGVVIAVNRIGGAYPGRIDHWVSCHPEKFPDEWFPMRRGPRDFRVWGAIIEAEDRDDRRLPWVDDAIQVLRVGSSGMMGVEIARQRLQRKRIVCAGIPLLQGQHFNGGPAWNAACNHWPAWADASEEWDDEVRSMSGWTRELLGAPDRAWLGLKGA